MDNFLRLKNLLVVTVVAVLAMIIVQQRRVIANLRDTVQGLSAKSSAPSPLPVAKQEPVTQPVEEVNVATAPVLAVTVTQSPPAATEPAMSSMFAKLRDMAKDPAFKDMIRAQQKMSMDMTYGSLFKKLELTGDDLSDFKNLLADRQMALMDAGMSMMGGNTTSADRERRTKEVAEIKAANDKKIEEFLGADGYGVFKDYEETQSERMQVTMFKNSLGGVEALTEQQEQDLVAAMYQERKSMPSPIPTQNSLPDPAQLTPDKIADLSKQMEQLQTRYLDRAATILTPPQLEQFKTAQERMRVMQTMGLKMATQMFGQKTAPPVSPPVTPTSP